MADYRQYKTGYKWSGDPGHWNSTRTENIGKGLVSGAVTGGTIGSFVPVIGTTVGAAVGAGIGGLWGLFSPTEQQELAERYAKGEVSPEQEEMLADMIKDRYFSMRKQMGLDLARRGLGGSTMSARALQESYRDERDAYVDAIQNQSFRNRGFGADIIAERNRQNQQFGASVGSMISDLAVQKHNERMWERYMGNQNPGVSAPNSADALPSVSYQPSMGRAFADLQRQNSQTAGGGNLYDRLKKSHYGGLEYRLNTPYRLGNTGSGGGGAVARRGTRTSVKP